MIKLGPDDWWFSSSSTDDAVYLRWKDAGPDKTVLLGRRSEVAARLADFLSEIDFGDAVVDAGKPVS